MTVQFRLDHNIPWFITRSIWFFWDFFFFPFRFFSRLVRIDSVLHWNGSFSKTVLHPFYWFQNVDNAKMVTRPKWWQAQNGDATKIKTSLNCETISQCNIRHEFLVPLTEVILNIYVEMIIQNNMTESGVLKNVRKCSYTTILSIIMRIWALKQLQKDVW